MSTTSDRVLAEGPDEALASAQALTLAYEVKALEAKLGESALTAAIARAEKAERERDEARAKLSELAAATGFALLIAALAPNEEPVDTPDHAIVDAVRELRSDRDTARQQLKEAEAERDSYKDYADAAKDALERLVDPVTGDHFFMLLSREWPDGEVSHLVTFGGPYDSYTLCERDNETPDDGSVGFQRERYDHDRGKWVDGCEAVAAVMLDDEGYARAVSIRDVVVPAARRVVSGRSAEWLRKTAHELEEALRIHDCSHRTRASSEEKPAEYVPRPNNEGSTVCVSCGAVEKEKLGPMARAHRRATIADLERLRADIIAACSVKVKRSRLASDRIGDRTPPIVWEEQPFAAIASELKARAK